MTIFHHIISLYFQLILNIVADIKKIVKMECSIEMLEQPARKVKFRMEVHSHRCQQKELLLGRVRQKTTLLVRMGACQTVHAMINKYVCPAHWGIAYISGASNQIVSKLRSSF